MGQSPVVKMKSEVAWSMSVAGWVHEKSCSLGIKKSVKNKETGAYDDTVIYVNLSEAAALLAMLPQAICDLSRATQEYKKGARETPQNSIESSKNSVNDHDDIPF